MEINLSLRRNFDRVCAGFFFPFYNLVPNEFLSENPETLLSFSESEFDRNLAFESPTELDCSFVYGAPEGLVEFLRKQYGRVCLTHSGQIFLDTIEKTDRALVHLNLNNHNIEIAVTEDRKLKFYNLFETPKGEDILFYTLFAMEQLGLDTNAVPVRCYGGLISKNKVFHFLKKYIRYPEVAEKDENYVNNYTIYNLSKCASSQDH